MDGHVSGDLCPIERFISVHLTNDLRCTLDREDTKNQVDLLFWNNLLMEFRSIVAL